MSSLIIRVPVFAMSLWAFAAAAAQAQVCVRIDESHDTLTPADRTAAVLLITKQFTLNGEQVAAECDTPYLLSHVKLGNTIAVTLSGPRGIREGTALGLDDLPALYSQMVRSLVTGRPMEGLRVVDRTNVTAAQTTAKRVHSDAFTYARLGYSGIFGDRTYGAPSFGLGYRAELDALAIDISFLNVQAGSSSDYYNGASAGGFSVLKLSGLYLLDRTGNSTPYFGGGMSWGNTNFNRGQSFPVARGVYETTYTTGWNGSGLRGELSAGYEFARATTIRAFVQTDAILPFYSVTAQTISTRSGVVSTSRRYAPSLVVSLGLGWQRNRK